MYICYYFPIMWLEKFIVWLRCPTTPWKAFGWQHILTLLVIVCLTALLIIFARNVKRKTYSIIVMSMWAVCLIFEILKQLLFSYDPSTGWKFQWYFAPTNFCATFLFVCPFAIFIKKDKFNAFASGYLAIFCTLGSLLMIIAPEGALNSYFLFINIQTLVYHALMLSTSIYIVVYNRKQLNLRYFLKTPPVFIFIVIIAVIFNETAFKINNTTLVHCLDIARHMTCSFPVLHDIDIALSKINCHWLFVVLYTLFFCMGAFITYVLEYIIVNKNFRFYKLKEVAIRPKTGNSKKR